MRACATTLQELITDAARRLNSENDAFAVLSGWPISLRHEDPQIWQVRRIKLYLENLASRFLRHVERPIP